MGADPQCPAATLFGLEVCPGRFARERPGQRQVRGVENAGGDRRAGPAGDPGHADLGHVARSSMPTLRKRHMLERLALASRRLSSRHSLPGPIALSAALAVGEDTGVVDRRHTLTPLGPGDKIGRDTSELQSLMRISYAVFCLKKKTNTI